MAKTFYLYGHGEHKTPLAITLKQSDKVVGTASLPHDKAETTEDVSDCWQARLALVRITYRMDV